MPPARDPNAKSGPTVVLTRLDARGTSRGALSVVVAVYLVCFGALLLHSDFLPYVMDNNESFSAYFHARNLLTYDLSQSAGLTDESFAFHPAAHPYPYTHGGNLPRLMVALLTFLGADDIRWQIAISTFTVGLAGILLAFRFFREISTPGFAALTCILFITDYVMFAQWQVVTWRVWHGVFFFSTLLLARSCIAGRDARLWLLAALNHALLFYYELTFAVFVSLAAGLYALLSFRRTPWRVIGLGFVQLGGAVVACAVLVAQIAHYLGWDGFVEDLHLTFVGRNQASSPQEMLAAMQAFSESRQLAVWYNVMDAAHLRSLGGLLHASFAYILQVYAPAFVLLVSTLALGWALSLACMAFGRAAGFEEAERGTSWLARPRRWLEGAARSPAWFLRPAYALLAILVLGDGRFAAVRISWLQALAPGALASLLIGVLGTLLIARWLEAAWGSPTRRARPLTRFELLGGVVTLLAPALLIRVQPSLYDGFFRPLSQALLDVWPLGAIPRLAFLGAAALSARLVLAGPSREELSGGVWRIRGLAPFLLASGLAYSICYLLSPGYMLSGYLYRYAPFTVFFHEALFALGFWLLALAGREEWHALAHAPWVILRRHRHAGDGEIRVRQVWPRIVATLVPLGAIGVALAFACVHWLALQYTYLRLLPPDHYGFLLRLREPPFVGASFVSNNYAAPVAAFTGTWAYLDPEIGQGDWRLTDDGWTASQDLRYLWFADRRTNPAYRTPKYFICMMGQDLRTAVQRLQMEDGGEVLGCTRLPLVKQLRDAEPGPARHRLVARDESGRDRWAIIQLDWELPPYLRPLTSAKPSRRVDLCVEQHLSGALAKIAYEYAQQGGAPELDSQVTLFELSPGETPGSVTRRLLASSKGVRELALPRDFTGSIQAAVLPRSASKPGLEVFSEPVQVEQHATKTCP